jgi:hypothetical protein
VNQAIAPDRAALQRRASEAGAKGTPIEETAAFRLLVANEIASDQQRAVQLAELAALGAAVRKSPPAGARWATSLGCGIEIEGAPDSLGIACGMGYVPAVSQRFLTFYTEGS